MENTPLKSSLFGGFNRQDVIDYISKISSEANAQTTELQKELSEAIEQQNTLQDQCDSLQEDCSAIQSKLTTLEEQNATLNRELERQRTLSQALSGELSNLRASHEALSEENELLRKQAEEYARMKAHIAEIELSARQRANALMNAAQAETVRMLSSCQVNYDHALQTLSDACNDTVALLQTAQQGLANLPERFQAVQDEWNEVINRLFPQE